MTFEENIGIIMDAFRAGDLETVKQYIDLVDRSNTFRMNGMSLLEIACTMGQTEIAKYLVSHGADVEYHDNEGDTALHQATNQERPELIKFLCSLGMDVDVRNDRGHTPLMVAAYLRKAENVKALLECGADATLVGDGSSVLEWALAQGNAPHAEIVKDLLKAGADYNDLYSNYCAFAFFDDYHPNPQTIVPWAEYAPWMLDDPNATVMRINPNSASLSYVFRRPPAGSTQSTRDDDRAKVGDVRIPEDFAAILEGRIDKCLQLSYPLESFEDHLRTFDGARGLSDEQMAKLRESLKSSHDLSGVAIDAKRRGDLAAANDAYLKMFQDDIFHTSQYTWGWFKVLMLAKNFKDAHLVLRYYHASSACMNYLLRDAGELDFDNTPISDSFLTLEFDAYEVFQDCTQVSPLDREGLVDKIRAFGGDARWDAYSLNDEEYDSFLHYFLSDDMLESDQDGTNDAIRHMLQLEREIQEGNAYAYSSLARYYLDDDRAFAIELCEAGLEAGDATDAPYVLAWLLEGSDSSRSKQLYEMAAVEGGNADSAFNLANLVQAEDPDKAKRFYRQAIAAGNAKAQVRLAKLIMDDDPDEAIRLCDEALANGEQDESPFMLAYLLEGTNPERSKELYEQVIAAGSYYGAANNLANLIKAENPERAAELFQMAIDDGNTFTATKNLADLIKGTDPERAAELYEIAIEAGNVRECAYELANLVLSSDSERAKSLYEMAIDAGDEFSATFMLARLVEASDPERAQALYERSITAGDMRASTYYLANLIKDTEPDRAIELYRQSAGEGLNDARAALARMIYVDNRQEAIDLCEAAVADGDENDGAFFLAWLLQDTDRERSMELYQKCIDAGYIWGPARNLGHMLKDEDPQRAVELFEMSLQAGNKEIRVPLARLIAENNKERAIELCEEAVADGDEDDGALFLGFLLEGADVERSKALYQKCVDAGHYWAAANNLANLIKSENPELAEELFKKAIESGNRGLPAENLARLCYSQDRLEDALRYYEMAFANGRSESRDLLIDYGALMMTRNADMAIELSEKAMKSGDQVFSPCNLGHMRFLEDPDEARRLYELAIEHEQGIEATEAYIGLALLTMTADECRADKLLHIAKERENFESSISFMADYYDSTNSPQAEQLRSLLQ